MANEAQMKQKIQAALDAATGDPKGLPNAVFVAVDRTGKELAAAASGKAGIEHDVPVDVDTIMTIFSSTKLYVSIAALQLVEQGKISLDDAEQVKLGNLSPTRTRD